MRDRSRCGGCRRAPARPAAASAGRVLPSSRSREQRAPCPATERAGSERAVRRSGCASISCADRRTARRRAARRRRRPSSTTATTPRCSSASARSRGAGPAPLHGVGDEVQRRGADLALEQLADQARLGGGVGRQRRWRPGAGRARTAAAPRPRTGPRPAGQRPARWRPRAARSGRPARRPTAPRRSDVAISWLPWRSSRRRSPRCAARGRPGTGRPRARRGRRPPGSRRRCDPPARWPACRPRPGAR